MKIQYRPKRTDAFVDGEEWHDIDHDAHQCCADDLIEAQFPRMLEEADILEVDEGGDPDGVLLDADLDDYFEFRIAYGDNGNQFYSVKAGTADEWVDILHYARHGDDAEDRAEAFMRLCGETYFPREFKGLYSYEDEEAYGRMLYDNSGGDFKIPDGAINFFDFDGYGVDAIWGEEYVEVGGRLWFKG